LRKTENEGLSEDSFLTKMLGAFSYNGKTESSRGQKTAVVNRGLKEERYIIRKENEIGDGKGRKSGDYSEKR